jgi:DMSO/TMAO reductase YedYZ molybdopterin-dependent catalytic subunit
MTRRGITRRAFLTSTVVATGAAAAGAWAWRWAFPSSEPLALASGKLLDTDFPDPFADGQLLGYLPFDLEGQGSPLVPGQTNEHGHNARRIIDPASLLMPSTRVTPAADFYIRTEYPDLLKAPKDWKIKISGEVRKPQDLPLPQLDSAVEPKGPVLLECSGNHRALRFGLLSVADWEGISIGKVLDLAEPTTKATSVLINGFDDDSNLPDNGPPYRDHSMPTCSWIFTREQLDQTGAFLATRMNGQPLPKDQGAPVRLVVPGWYGCTEVKWINKIQLVDNNEPATLQMLEFSDRTGQQTHEDPTISTSHQVGPKLARDYLPASIDQAALPVRVEQWTLGEKLVYRVVGITWGGGPNRTEKLKIRFRLVDGRRRARDTPYEPVLFCKASTSISSYGIWVHRWEPTKPGHYLIDVRLNAPGLRSRRMESQSSLTSQVGSPKVQHFERAVTIPRV